MAKHKPKHAASGSGGKRTGSRLAGALAQAQAKEAQLRKAKHAQTVREQQAQAQRANNGGQKKQRMEKGKQRAEQQCMFQPGERILLIGEGNFSFAASLVSHHSVPGSLVTATCYDSSEALHSKYPDVTTHLATLEAAGAEIMFDVDAGALDTDRRTRGRRWDRVCWLFPHVGMGIKDEARNVRANQVELMRFLRAVKEILNERSGASDGKRPRVLISPDDDEEGAAKGSIDLAARPGRLSITLRNTLPYTLWDLPSLAKRGPALAPSILHPAHPSLRNSQQPRYTLLQSARFNPSAFPGYSHRRTIGWKEGMSTEGCEDISLPARERGKGGLTGVTGAGEARTWEFELARDVA